MLPVNEEGTAATEKWPGWYSGSLPSPSLASSESITGLSRGNKLLDNAENRINSDFLYQVSVLCQAKRSKNS